MSGCAQGVCRDGAVIAAGNRSASAGFKPDWQRPRGFRYGATVRLCPVVPRTGDRRGQHLRGVLDLCGLPTSGAGAGDAVPDEHQPRAHPTALPVSWTITPGRVSSPKKSIAASSRRAAKGASGPRAPTKRSKSALAHKRSLLTSSPNRPASSAMGLIGIGRSAFVIHSPLIRSDGVVYPGLRPPRRPTM